MQSYSSDDESGRVRLSVIAAPAVNSIRGLVDSAAMSLRRGAPSSDGRPAFDQGVARERFDRVVAALTRAKLPFAVSPSGEIVLCGGLARLCAPYDREACSATSAVVLSRIRAVIDREFQ